MKEQGMLFPFEEWPICEFLISQIWTGHIVIYLCLPILKSNILLIQKLIELLVEQSNTTETEIFSIDLITPFKFLFQIMSVVLLSSLDIIYSHFKYPNKSSHRHKAQLGYFEVLGEVTAPITKALNIAVQDNQWITYNPWGLYLWVKTDQRKLLQRTEMLRAMQNELDTECKVGREKLSFSYKSIMHL